MDGFCLSPLRVTFARVFAVFMQPVSPQASRLTKDPKYTYVRLSELKPGAVVNVYGVVVFFKQPCRTRGTGQSSTPVTSVWSS